MIRSFADRRTAALFEGYVPKGVPADVAERAKDKLRMIHAAPSLDALRVPPGNRLKALVGDRRGRHSVRVNDQWRICFVWRGGGADDVEFTDYH
jgi:proteic killer suppression protein